MIVGNYYGNGAGSHDVTHIDNPDPAHRPDPTYHPESLSSVSSCNHPELSMPESSDGGPGSIQVSEEGHRTHANFVSPGQIN